MILKLKEFNELTEEAKENLSMIECEGMDYALSNYINPNDYIVDEESQKKFAEANQIVDELKTHLENLFEQLPVD